MSSSTPDALFELLDEFAAAYARGESPRAEEYLVRAGARAEELAALLAEWLERAPRPEPDAATVALVGAWMAHEPPLVALRVQHGLRVDAVVKELMGALGLDPPKRAKVKRLYQQLEQGLLEPRRVSEKVWDVLGKLLGPGVQHTAGWRPAELRGAAVAYNRLPDPGYAAGMPSPPMERAGLRSLDDAEAEPPDEIDHLFGVA